MSIEWTDVVAISKALGMEFAAPTYLLVMRHAVASILGPKPTE